MCGIRWVDWHFVCTGLIGVWHAMGRLALCVYRADRCVARVDWYCVYGGGQIVYS